MEEKIKLYEFLVFGEKETPLSEKEQKILDTQADFFSKQHYYDEDGFIISKEEAFK